MNHSQAIVDPAVTAEVVSKHGLTPEEFERIKKILGREPNFTELMIFSVMRSEHCSYKNARKELRKFPTNGRNILVKAAKKTLNVQHPPQNARSCEGTKRESKPVVAPAKAVKLGVGAFERCDPCAAQPVTAVGRSFVVCVTRDNLSRCRRHACRYSSFLLSSVVAAVPAAIVKLLQATHLPLQEKAKRLARIQFDD
jgi:hypothetical protein